MDEARTLSEKLSAESQMLADKLKMEQQNQEALVGDITELKEMQDKETSSRVQAENDFLEATEVVEALQKRSEGRRRRSPVRTRTSCCKQRSFSLCFGSRRGGGAVY